MTNHHRILFIDSTSSTLVCHSHSGCRIVGSMNRHCVDEWTDQQTDRQMHILYHLQSYYIQSTTYYIQSYYIQSNKHTNLHTMQDHNTILTRSDKAYSIRDALTKIKNKSTSLSSTQLIFKSQNLIRKSFENMDSR